MKRSKPIATALTLLWMSAAYALPALHQVGHQDDHIHLPGNIVLFGKGPHNHQNSHAHDYNTRLAHYFDEDFDWDTEETAPEPAPENSTPSNPVPFSHGIGSLAHNAGAALTPTPLLEPPKPALFSIEQSLIFAPEHRPSLHLKAPQQARAPPRA